MADLVVTCPKWFWFDWIDEGDAAGTPPTGEEWGFTVGWRRPPIAPGERLYIVAHDRLRGYAPVTRVAAGERGWAIGRQAGAVAVTIDETIIGFQGFRERWWPVESERPFAAWKTDNVAPEHFRRYVRKLLDDFYTPAEARIWLRSPQPILGMETPDVLIARGDGAKVLVPLHQMRDGAYA